MSTQAAEGNSKILRISGYVLGVLGVALVVFGVFFIKSAMESVSWPQADAQVVSSVVRWRYIDGARNRIKTDSDKQYYYEVTYSYNVDGIPYTSSRYSLGTGYTASSMFNEREEADVERKEIYPQGKAITIFYDPNSPTSAVISNGMQWSTTVPLVLGLFFFGTAFLLIKSAKLIDAKGEIV
ncbi:MAG: DUF3592 domain-containing protein [Deltaproteobacteria bacterium]|nr:DUF3592 domain-containing protein [Deltaproteobacteria bacterium]